MLASSLVNLKNNFGLVFWLGIFLFPVVVRIIPTEFILLFFVSVLSILILGNFYLYINNKFKTENQITQYSWGFIREDGKSLLRLDELINFLQNKPIRFYTNYLSDNKEYLSLLFILLADLFIAIKNLSYSEAGAYLILSALTKFVFLAYWQIDRQYKKTLTKNPEKIDYNKFKILDIFYSHFSGLLSVSFLLIFLFFFLEKYIVEIFLGTNFKAYQTSLTFVFVANLTLLFALLIFRTSLILNSLQTWKILKIYAILFSILFIFIDINHVDTVAFFTSGSISVLSIFLYNFCIRQPVYTKNIDNPSL